MGKTCGHVSKDAPCDLCGAPNPVTMATISDPRARHLARHQRYNLSVKGQARNRRYEAAHPDRKLRWEPARNRPRNPAPNRTESEVGNG